jgi:hypothetical protein
LALEWALTTSFLMKLVDVGGQSVGVVGWREGGKGLASARICLRKLMKHGHVGFKMSFQPLDLKLLPSVGQGSMEVRMQEQYCWVLTGGVDDDAITSEAVDLLATASKTYNLKIPGMAGDSSGRMGTTDLAMANNCRLGCAYTIVRDGAN